MHMKRLLRDERGVSAVEFALIAPIMILLYCGLAELTLAMMAERRASHAASAVGDLIAQERGTISDNGITQVLNVGKLVVSPFSAADLTMRISSVQADPSGTPMVVWSKAQGAALSPLQTGVTPLGFPTTLLAANESVIMSDVVYAYETPLKKVVNRKLHFSETFYLRPRRADEIVCTDCPAVP